MAIQRSSSSARILAMESELKGRKGTSSVMRPMNSGLPVCSSSEGTTTRCRRVLPTASSRGSISSESPVEMEEEELDLEDLSGVEVDELEVDELEVDELEVDDLEVDELEADELEVDELEVEVEADESEVEVEESILGS